MILRSFPSLLAFENPLHFFPLLRSVLTLLIKMIPSEYDAQTKKSSGL